MNDFKELGKLLEEYHNNKKLFRDNIHRWLKVDKHYYSYSVKVDSDKVKLHGSGECLSSEDILEFMSNFNLVLVRRVFSDEYNCNTGHLLYPDGEYKIYTYEFH